MSYIPPSDSLNLLNASGDTINPATEEALILLRRMVKLMEPLATQDSQQRQRIALDTSTVTLTVAQATAGNLNANIGTVNVVNQLTNIVQFGGVDPRFQFIDAARNAYANGIRQNLNFS
jgi:hypothetical protein